MNPWMPLFPLLKIEETKPSTFMREPAISKKEKRYTILSTV